MIMCVSFLLISLGIAAEVNLLRLFAGDWLKARRELRRRQLPAAGACTTIVHSTGRWAPRLAAASVAISMMPLIAAAQQEAPSTTTPSAPDARAAAEAPVIPAAPLSLTISTDRPSFSDTTGIVPIGRFQLETGYTFTFRDRDDVETQRHNGPEILARVALIEDRLELRFITSGYTWSRTDDGSGSGFASAEGWNDITLGLKLKLLDQEGFVPRLALGAQTTLGTGSRAVSNREVEPTLKLIWSYDLEKLWGDNWKGFGVYGNFNLAYPTTNGDRFVQGAGSICGTYAINDKLGVFAEYYVVGPNSKGTDAAHYADFGAAYLLNNHIQLDARLGIGLNQEADNMFVGIGISFLF